ncbi:MAG: ABC transporter ATP-binding protein [Bdellovibrio sp.]|nr:ABC transporter ATP-binding protein [Bdellovibrio sp.]
MLNKLAWKFWRDFLWQRRVIYLIGAITVLVTNFMQVIVTRSLGWILDFFTGKPIILFPDFWMREETFLSLFVIFFLGRVLLTVGRFGWRVTLARQTHVAAAHMRRLLWQNARYFPKYAIDRIYTKGHMINIASSDVGQGQLLFGFTLVAVVDLFCLGILTLSAMVMINPSLAFFSVCSLFFIPFVVRRLSHLEGAQYHITQDILSRLDDLAAQMIASVRLQRLTRTGGYWARYVLGVGENYRRERLKTLGFSLSYIPAMGTATLLSYGVLFLVGTYYVILGRISIGDFIAMQGLVALIQDPFMEMGFIISEWKRGISSLERIMEVYEAPKETYLLDGSTQAVMAPIGKSGGPVFTVQNLTFQYGEGLEPVFKHLNFELKEQGRLGLIGPIATGKTTLINILMGLERNYQGKVLFRGQGFEQFGHLELRRQIGHVSQRPFLFASTIRENLKLDRDMSDEEIWHYLKMSELLEDVRKFPHGLDTSLGEWGINLSGGQKQRLTLARALARIPSVLLFDDCLSAVDTVTEEKILKNIDHEMKNVTIVWAAHRASTLKYCDRILEMGSKE